MVKRLYPDQPIVGVGAIVLREGMILLIKRGNEPSKGKWTIPGGVVDVGERLEVAVARETKEEVGLTAEKIDLVDVVDQVQLDEEGKVEYHYVIIDYIVKVGSGEPTAGSDAQELKWVQMSDVEAFDLTQSFRRFFVKNKKKLVKLGLGSKE